MSEWTLRIPILVLTLLLAGQATACAATKPPRKSEFTPPQPETTLLRFPFGPVLIVTPSLLRPSTDGKNLSAEAFDHTTKSQTGSRFQFRLVDSQVRGDETMWHGWFYESASISRLEYAKPERP